MDQPARPARRGDPRAPGETPAAERPCGTGSPSAARAAVLGAWVGVLTRAGLLDPSAGHITGTTEVDGTGSGRTADS
jgi:hypothetical protein